MVDATIYVSSQAELYEALQKATGGETILLAPGNYGELGLWSGSGFNIAPTSQITLASLDPENSASFSELHLNGVSNYTFSNLTFDYTFSSEDPSWYRPFEINGSTSIQILDSVFDGDVATGISEAADGFGYAYGLSVRGSESVEIAGNEFTTWLRAAIFSDTDNLIVSENEIHSIRSDGLDFVQVTNVVIERNYIHDFSISPTSGDHVDYIQFWTNGTNEPSTNILIRENVLDMGDGGISQSIFLRNEEVDRGRAGLEMYYQDVVIEQNLILGGHLHGISVGETSGLYIQGNTILAAPNPDSTVNIPMINIAQNSSSVSIMQNAVARINGYVDQTDWSISGNAFIQNTDPNAPGYYADVFVESSMFGSRGVLDYIVAPGSMLEQLQAGYSGLFPISTTEDVRALFDVSTSSDDMNSLIFDGRFSFSSGGTALPEGTTFLWTLESGETFIGPVLQHSFQEPGFHKVELLISTPDGSVSTAVATVSVAGPDLLRFDQANGSFFVSGYGETSVVSQSDVASTSLSSGHFGIDLGGTGTQVTISRHSIERVFGAESMELSFTIQADQPGASGEVFRLHSSFIANINALGELQFQLYSDSGEKVLLTTTGAALNDGDAHDVSVSLDHASSSLSIFIDGTILAKSVVFGSLPDLGSWDLAFGNPWGGQNFDGKLLSFELDVSNNDYPIWAGPSFEEVLAMTYVVDDSPGTSTSEPEAGVHSLPEIDGYRTDFLGLAAGSEGRLFGNAFVDSSGLQPALMLDGKNDSARLGTIAELEDASKLTLEVNFALGGDSVDFQALVTDSSKISIQVDLDSVKVFVGSDSDSAFSAVFTASNLSLAGSGIHSLRVIADSDSDRFQLLLDGNVVLDSREQAFSFDNGAQNWWTKGLVIGEGGRRVDDFDGMITHFAVDDTALFIGV